VRIGSTASAGTCPSADQEALDALGAHSFDRARVKVSGVFKEIKSARKKYKGKYKGGIFMEIVAIKIKQGGVKNEKEKCQKNRVRMWVCMNVDE